MLPLMVSVPIEPERLQLLTYHAGAGQPFYVVQIDAADAHGPLFGTAEAHALAPYLFAAPAVVECGP